jgi:hypothetical protein
MGLTFSDESLVFVPCFLQYFTNCKMFAMKQVITFYPLRQNTLCPSVPLGGVGLCEVHDDKQYGSGQTG